MPDLFQIHEADLAELEQALPQLMHAHTGQQVPREKVKWRRVIEILKNVRWNYGPWQKCERADDELESEGEDE